MTKRMLIDAGHPEETRVVIVDGTKVDELDFESAAKKQLRGNLYLARVTRVEPSLQAAFVEYGGNRHGFLAFSEIHPDYYQIPYEDRMALLEAEEAEAKERAAEEEAEDDAEAEAAEHQDPETGEEETEFEEDGVEVADETSEDGESIADSDAEKGDDIDSDADDELAAKDNNKGKKKKSKRRSKKSANVESLVTDADEDVADEQEKTAHQRRSRSFRHKYKIQEVIKRGQILLIQVVKEERGNKGAAMTTYLSLAGRYCVLMPNTPKGGGISRKISNGSDRKRLKSIVSEFKVPQGMGVIVRTAGAKRTKTEIKRDYDYLCRLWETIRSTTLESIAPALIHEEGNLVKRSIRDLYNKDIKEVLVQGDEAYKTAKDFIKMLMPSHAKNVKAYKEEIPLFLRYQVESQIEDSLESVVQLKSGGYLVIHPTEALVSVDVNSGRSTKERNVERTALKTNLEAAEEVARQMRLRDLAGLVVIDFIDMDEYRNNRAVEKRMKEALSNDRARVQAGRISQFGLMEISRQRRRRSLLEGSTISCPHCEGVGRKRTIESSALKALRALEELAARAQTEKAKLRVAPDVAAFILNHKRDELQEIHDKFSMYAVVEADPEMMSPQFELVIEEKRTGKNEDPLAEIEKELKKEKSKRDKSSKKGNSKDKSESSDEPEDEDDEDTPRKRRRRGRRGGRRRKTSDENVEENSNEENNNSDKDETGSDEKPKSRRRRTPKKSKDTDSDKSETQKDEKGATTDEDGDKTDKPKSRRRRSSKKAEKSAEVEDAKIDGDDATPKKTRRRAPAKAKTKTDTKKDEEKPKSKTKAASSEKPSDDNDVVTSDAPKPKATKSTTRRKAPSRTAKAEETEKKTEDKPKKPTRSRKKKADAVEPEKETKPQEKKKAGKKRVGWWSRKS